MTGHRPRSGGGWRPALRIARRELLRARGRTALVLLMVLLPLTAVVGLDTLLRTADRSVAERLPGELGTAQARIVPQYGRVQQDPDASQSFGGGGPSRVVLTTGEVAAVLAADARVIPVREGSREVPVRTRDGRTARVGLVGVDLREPSLRGPYLLRSGRAPATDDEVAVSLDVARFGFGIGSPLRLPGGRSTTVVGTLRPDPDGATRVVAGLPEALGLSAAPPSRFYVAGPPVTWADVLQLNRLGALVLSRSVVLDPPPDDQVPPLPGGSGDTTTLAVIGLIAVIAVLEVVLLAGPAFAVGARRQRRALALMAAGGAEPRHVRRVVLAQGIYVGLTAAALAVLLGIGGAALARAPLTRYADASWGRFEVSARDVSLLCLLGVGTAVLAALAPAVLASRQPVVAALQGRRTTSGRTWVPTAVGSALLVLGVLACFRSLRATMVNTEFWVAVSAVPTVLGAAALAPGLLHLAGRGAARLPLPLRFAVRDADRQRGRTAPAVAAVTAVVAGVVALATASGSDAASQRTIAAPASVGGAVVQVYGADADYAALEGAARRALPGAPVQVVRGIARGADEQVERELLVCRPEEPAAPSCTGFGVGYGGRLGTSAVVGASMLPLAVPQANRTDRADAEAALRAGRVLVAGAPAGTAVELRLVDHRFDEVTGQDRTQLVAATTVTAAPLVARDGTPDVAVVLTEAAAEDLGGSSPVSVVVGTEVSRAEQDRLQTAVERIDTGASVSVDRADTGSAQRLVVLLLFLGAGFLVLAGSLAATSLALTEARPDLATMGQVGARPLTRRLVAASYAYVLALVGAVLGTAAGLVPGVAGAVALTRGGAYAVSTGPRGFANYTEVGTPLTRVDVPWLLLLGLVVALPLLTAVVAALSTRSRLPGLGRRVRA